LAVLWTGAQTAVAAFIRGLVRRRDECEELLQRTAVTLVRKFDQYDRQRPFVPWAIGVAKYEVLGYWREQDSDRLVFDGKLVEQIADRYCRVAEEGPPMQEMVVDCVAKLDGRAREAIQLRYARRLKSLRIAEIMGLSHGAARMLLSRARTALRVCVEEALKRFKS
jgi:RNA polymerase sigma-70 factor (ECF subfamily)